MEFESYYAKWLSKHRKKRRGERLRRLVDGHNIPEQMFVRQILFPVFHSFAYMHPEFEVRGFEGAPIFIDIAYIRGPIKVAFELDGYGPHQRDIDRARFAYDRRRDLWLRSQGWNVLRVAFSEIEERPHVIQKHIRSALRRYERNILELSVHEREVIRIALVAHRHIIKVSRITEQLELGRDKSRALLRGMEEKGLLEIYGKATQRINRYRLNTQSAIVQNIVAGM
jgi:hypothetical protein